MTANREFILSEAKAAGWFLFMVGGYTGIAALVAAAVICLIMEPDPTTWGGAFLHGFLFIHKGIWLLLFTLVIALTPLLYVWKIQKTGDNHNHGKR